MHDQRDLSRLGDILCSACSRVWVGVQIKLAIEKREISFKCISIYSAVKPQV